MLSVTRELKVTASGVEFCGRVATLETLPKSMKRYSTLPVQLPRGDPQCRRPRSSPPWSCGRLKLALVALALAITTGIAGFVVQHRVSISVTTSSTTTSRLEPLTVPDGFDPADRQAAGEIEQRFRDRGHPETPAQRSEPIQSVMDECRGRRVDLEFGDGRIAGLAGTIIVARPRSWREPWKSASMPATQGPDCQLKPSWPPPIHAVDRGVGFGHRGSDPVVGQRIPRRCGSRRRCSRYCRRDRSRPNSMPSRRAPPCGTAVPW